MKTSTETKAGGITMNHSTRSLRIKTGVKAGGGGGRGGPGAPPANHNARILRVKTGVRLAGRS